MIKEISSQMVSYNETREAIDYCKKYFHGQLLDVGAGNGKYKGMLSGQTDKYFAVDIAPGPNIDLVADIHNTGLPDASFDTIVCTQVIEHVKNPFRVLEEIKRLLRPGGVCFVSAPFMYPYHPDPKDFFRFSAEGLQSFFAEGQDEIILVGKSGGFFSQLANAIKISFVNKYEGFSALNGKIFGRLIRLLNYIDRFYRSERIYCSSFVLVKKN